MASFATALAGGMGATGGGSLLGMAFKGVSLLSSFMSARAQANAGIMQQYQYEQQAKLEEVRANEESIGRREKLIEALAMQNAKVGAGGVGGTTPLTVQLEDMRQFEREDFAQDTVSKMRQEQYRTAGKAAASSAKTQAGVSLLSGVTSAFN